MRKEKSILIGILIALIVGIPGCKEELESPKVCYTLRVKSADGTKIMAEPYIVETNEDIEFDNCGAADYFAYFSGKPGSIWADFQDPNDSTTKGTDTNPYGGFVIKYSDPGTYTVTVVLTNREVKNPTNSRMVTVDFEIKVVAPESAK
jgi:hypothetical protein